MPTLLIEKLISMEKKRIFIVGIIILSCSVSSWQARCANEVFAYEGNVGFRGIGLLGNCEYSYSEHFSTS